LGLAGHAAMLYAAGVTVLNLVLSFFTITPVAQKT
jgi:hypothetical protein